MVIRPGLYPYYPSYAPVAQAAMPYPTAMGFDPYSYGYGWPPVAPAAYGWNNAATNIASIYAVTLGMQALSALAWSPFLFAPFAFGSGPFSFFPTWDNWNGGFNWPGPF